jgi:hypothetical protein
MREPTLKGLETANGPNGRIKRKIKTKLRKRIKSKSRIKIRTSGRWPSAPDTQIFDF